MYDDLDLEQALDVARRAVDAGGRAALRHFTPEVRVDTKADRSPVTAGDREGEAAVFEVLAEAFPEHTLLGEETGTHAGRPGRRWILDPIDGTRGFTRGGSFWGPLLALEADGEVVVGVMALPALGRTYWAARGLGAWRDGTRLEVSGVSEWAEATLALGEMRALLDPPHGEGVLGLVRSAASTRCPGDLAGPAMVLDGQADAWLEAGVQRWDLGPVPVLVAEAGGRFTDLAGRPSLDDGSAIVTNGRLHAHVLEALGAPAAGAGSR